jgi:hypothetical protein
MLTVGCDPAGMLTVGCAVRGAFGLGALGGRTGSFRVPAVASTPSIAV